MSHPPLELLLSPDYITTEILKVHRAIQRTLRERPVEAFKPYWFDTPKEKKQLAVVDFFAEQTFIEAVTSKFGSDNIRVVGEESLYKGESDLTDEERVCVLIDMIDGTDLLQRGFSNWCSAVVIFEPQKKKIKAAFVALSSQTASSSKTPSLYFAIQGKPGAFKKLLSDDPKHKNSRPIELAGPATRRSLNDATVCLYGQKNKNLLGLLTLAQKKKFVAWLERHVEKNDKRKKKAEEELAFRFYNLAGNPMMVRLAEGTVDVVFDLKGQAPHDVVPGAFIAMKAKAVLGEPGREAMITEAALAEKLLQPSKDRISYILAANKRMYRDLVQLLS